MTVSELIEQLWDLPQDAPVETLLDDHWYAVRLAFYTEAEEVVTLDLEEK